MKHFIQYRPLVAEYDGEWRWQSSGMGYIFQTDNGHFVVVDGGMDDEDAYRITELLKQYSDNPVVDLWIITHPHKDHCTALISFAKNGELKKQVTVNAVCFNNPDYFDERCKADIATMQELADMLKCKYIKALSGDVYSIDDIEICILFVWSDLAGLSDSNELSTIFTVSDGKTKVMIPGDTSEYVLNYICDKYKNTPQIFKSDIVQLPHHGLNGGTVEFFDLVQAKTVLVPISVAGYRVVVNDRDYGGRGNAHALSMADRIYYSALGTREIPTNNV